MLAFNMYSRALSKYCLDPIGKFKQVSETMCFDTVINKARIITLENGKCVAEMKVEPQHTNPIGTLHGGLSTTLIDDFTGYALLSNSKNYMQPSVSVALHLNFFKGALVGEEIVIDAETVTNKDDIAHLTCTIRNKKSGEILVEGHHTKCFLKEVKPFHKQ